MGDQWNHQLYESGTQIVTRMRAGEPHFYVYGPTNSDENREFQDRFQVTKDICDYLNGGKRPVWYELWLHRCHGLVPWSLTLSARIDVRQASSVSIHGASPWH